METGKTIEIRDLMETGKTMEARNLMETRDMMETMESMEPIEIMKTMEIIDCNAGIGYLSNDMRDFVNPSVENLVSNMRFCGVSKALCWERNSPVLSPAAGNRNLLQAIEQYPELYPVFVAVPIDLTGIPVENLAQNAALDMAQNAVLDMAQNMARDLAHNAALNLPTDPAQNTAYIPKQACLNERRLKGLRILPKKSNFSILPYASGEIFDLAQTLDIPVFISYTDASPDELYPIAKQYGGVNIIYTEVYYRDMRSTVMLMKNCPNVYLETSFIKVFHAFDRACRELGSERFVFGSGFPSYDMGPAIAMILSSALSREEKQNIFAGNIRRLCFGR